MSDDQINDDAAPTPGDDTPGQPEDTQPEDALPEDAPSGDAAPGDGPEASADAEETEDAGDAAAAALAAAQKAVAAAMGGGDEADDEEPTPEEAAMLAAAAAAVSDASGAAGRAIGPRTDADGTPEPFEIPGFDASPAAASPAELQLLGDVNVDVRIELGRTRMLVEDVLRLGEGAVVELEKLAGDPVDVFVNGRHVARGEVLVLNENFCVRVNEVIEPLPLSEPNA